MGTFIVWSFILIGVKEKKRPLGCFDTSKIDVRI